MPQQMRGQKLEGLTTIWDFYRTFSEGIARLGDVTDHEAAAASLPPLDSLNLWPYLSGEVDISPRDQVLLGTGNGNVNGIIISNISNGTTKIWKRLEGDVAFAGWTGPTCPNA